LEKTYLSPPSAILDENKFLAYLTYLAMEFLPRHIFPENQRINNKKLLFKIAASTLHYKNISGW
jgi:hypothetical protein